MTTLKKSAFLLLLGMVWLGGLEPVKQLSIPGVGSLVSTAKAEVGRPLTPVSVAGVARRSARR
jgi:hypothetical protein